MFIGIHNVLSKIMGRMFVNNNQGEVNCCNIKCYVEITAPAVSHMADRRCAV